MLLDRRHRLSLVGALILLAACTAREWVRDLDGALPGEHGDDKHALFVVDARTGRPVSRASVRLYLEDTRPEAFPGRQVAAFETDRYGLLTVDWDPRFASCHWVVEHRGYAPFETFGASRLDVVALEPGKTVHGRIEDEYHRPAKGVEVEYYLGCPHAPALRRAKTDENGDFVLHDIHPEEGAVWTQAPDTEADLLYPKLAPVPGFFWVTMRLAWGVTAVGTVEDEQGRPVPGAVVYSEQTPRGPRTRADALGRFRLAGLARDVEIRFHAADNRVLRPRWGRSGRFPDRSVDTRPANSLIVVRPPGDARRYTFHVEPEGSVEPESDGEVFVPTDHVGEVLLTFTHEEYGEGVLEVELQRGEARVGPEAFPVPGRIDVEQGQVEVWGRRGWEEVERNDFRLQPGARVRVTRDGWMPLLRVLKGKSPYAISWGSAALEFRRAGRIVCIVDGELLRGTDRLLVRGLDPGPHTVLFGGRAMRVVLAEGETRPIN